MLDRDRVYLTVFEIKSLILLIKFNVNEKSMKSKEAKPNHLWT